METKQASTSNETGKSAALTLILLLLSLCLLICGFFEHRFKETKYNYFGHLGQSFAEGRLDTPMLSGMLDVSTYETKTYLYWGPAGGWLFSLGSFLTDTRISDRVVAAILLAFNFWLWHLIVSEVSSAAQIPKRESALLLAFACVGGLFVTQFESPAVWQMGHILAYTGMSVVVYGICGRTLSLNTAVAGFCFAFLSRSSLLMLAPGLALLAILLLQRVNDNIRRTLFQMLVPTAIVLGAMTLMAAYNFLRFDSILEFGQTVRTVLQDNSNNAFFTATAKAHCPFRRSICGQYLFRTNPHLKALQHAHLAIANRNSRYKFARQVVGQLRHCGRGFVFL